MVLDRIRERIDGTTIPTLVPEHTWDKTKNTLTSGAWWLRLWRLLLLSIAIAVLIAAIVQPLGTLAAFFLTSVIAVLWMDDIKKSLLDLWRADFHEIEL